MRRAIWSSFVTFLLSSYLIPSLQAQHTIQTIAGGGPNGLAGLQSSVGSPIAISQDGSGNLYILDYDTQRVLKQDASGNITVLAGSGVCGTFWSTNPFSEPFSCESTIDLGAAQFGDGGAALSAQFQAWTGMAVDGPGNVYIASRCVIRKVDTNGTVNTFAGNGNCGYSGDGGPALNASLGFADGVFADAAGNLYIADTTNAVIRMVSASTGAISTVAGNGTPGYSGDGGPATHAEMAFPESIFVDAAGNIFITDDMDCVVREVSAATGNISTIAGNFSLGCGYSGDGGPATSAKLVPYAIVVDAQGNIYVSDPVNSVVREILAADGTISTVAGNVTWGAGYFGDGGPATNAALHLPYGITVDPSGNIFIAEFGNHVVREVSGGIINTSAGVFQTFLAMFDVSKNSSSSKAVSYVGVNTADGHSLHPEKETLQFKRRNPFAERGSLSISGVTDVIAPQGAAGVLHKIGLPYLGGEGALANEAPLGYPYHITTDAAGNIYIADKLGNDVREISVATGIVSTIAGSGISGSSGDGGPALNARLTYPTGVAVDASGNVYIADSQNCEVREMVAATGLMQAYAGTNHSCGFAGDGQAATSAKLGILGAISLDPAGNLFIADLANHRIREVTAADGIIHTVAGGGSSPGNGDGSLAASAAIGAPWGVLADTLDNLYIGDSQNCVVWKVTAADGIIHVFAGTYGSCGYSGDGGPATNAQIMYVFGSAYLDASGNFFLPDNANTVIREISAADGTISTVAGTGTPGFAGDGGDVLSAEFYSPVAVAGDTSGNLLVVDGMRIRSIAGLLIPPTPQVTLSTGLLGFASEPLNTAAPGSQVSITNTGSIAVAISSVALSGPNQADFSESDNCSGQSLAVGTSCTINVGFTPSAAGSENATLTINGTSGIQNVSLAGAGIDFSVSAASGGSTSAAVVQGQTATYSLQVLAAGGPARAARLVRNMSNASVSVNVSIACSGAPAETTCTVPVQSVVAVVGTPTAFTISVRTVAPQSNTPAKPSAGLPSGVASGFGLLMIGPLCMMLTGRNRRRRFWILVPLMLALLAVGCGDDSMPLVVGGTQPGVYTLQVTSTSGQDNHTTQLSLTVTPK